MLRRGFREQYALHRRLVAIAADARLDVPGARLPESLEMRDGDAGLRERGIELIQQGADHLRGGSRAPQPHAAAPVQPAQRRFGLCVTGIVNLQQAAAGDARALQDVIEPLLDALAADCAYVVI